MGRLIRGRRKPAQLRWATDQGKAAVTTHQPGRTAPMDKSRGYTGGRPASEMGPPAPLPSATIRPGTGGQVAPPRRVDVTSSPTIHEAFDDDSENTGPLPILGRDWLADSALRDELSRLRATVLRVDALADQAATWDLSKMTAVQVGNKLRAATNGEGARLRFEAASHD